MQQRDRLKVDKNLFPIFTSEAIKLTVEAEIVSQKPCTRCKEREWLSVRFGCVKVRWTKYPWPIPRCLSKLVRAMNFYGNADKAARARAFGRRATGKRLIGNAQPVGGQRKKERKEKKTRKIYATRIRAADTNHRFSGRARLSRHWFRPAARTRRYVSFFLFFFCAKRTLSCTSLPRRRCTMGWSRGPTRIAVPGHLISLSSVFVNDELKSDISSVPTNETTHRFYCEHHWMRILRYMLKVYFIIFIFQRDIFAKEYIVSKIFGQNFLRVMLIL